MFMITLRYVGSQVLYMLHDRLGVPSRRSMSECTSQACLFLLLLSYGSYGHMIIWSQMTCLVFGCEKKRGWHTTAENMVGAFPCHATTFSKYR